MRHFCTFLLLLTSCLTGYGQQPVFKIVPLGVFGGGIESNLSSYMIAPANSSDYVCLDAGTVRAGIRKAIENKLFPGQTDVQVLRRNIKGYLISHGHLDHLAGMVLNSPDDTSKYIYALPDVAKILTDRYFSWKSWANFTNEGETPHLSKYTFTLLDTAREVPLLNTGMQVTAFRLSHVNPYVSTAFLIRHNNGYVLYLGDTGSDAVEKTDRLKNLWQHIAPLVNKKQLKGILIETSFPDEQPDNALFGHLTPRLLNNELAVLNARCQPGMLSRVPVIITHIKPEGNHEAAIREQLLKNNPLKMHFLFPGQGKQLLL
ncbi:3',5'-cyclic-nucleotide phosphodiesterase [Niabella ginsenosidivorans]|uniref:3',5'-cyclic-nucleotide phosphodiesterase n=1 Tax=Niabella ginsenosidivorans TaxID=1176587 RepID=A0A1A9I2M1_9BACT|nr:3',5'-cyclic-nucleotide phosphodiesterase [Niabella ginsenosidivorans]ANH80960.1 3',5'-cyclic-nucleotide phosphodiesterase [Niabella ginsenosidivorans]